MPRVVLSRYNLVDARVNYRHPLKYSGLWMIEDFLMIWINWARLVDILTWLAMSWGKKHVWNVNQNMAGSISHDLRVFWSVRRTSLAYKITVERSTDLDMPTKKDGRLECLGIFANWTGGQSWRNQKICSVTPPQKTQDYKVSDKTDHVNWLI